MRSTRHFSVTLAATFTALVALTAGCSSSANSAAPASSASAPSTTQPTEAASPTSSGPAGTLPTPSAPTSAATSAGSTTGGSTAAGNADVLPLTIRRSGGIAGTVETITVTANGQVSVSHRGAAAKPSVPLGSAQLTDLTKLLRTKALAQVAATPSNRKLVCNDGYVYDIRTPHWTLQTDDCHKGSLPGLNPLLAAVLPLLRP